MEILPNSRRPTVARSFSILRNCSLVFVAILAAHILPLSSSAGVSYSDHCNAVVSDPPSLPDPNPLLGIPNFLSLRYAYVYLDGGDTTKGGSAIPRSLSLSSHKVLRTQRNAVFSIEATLNLIGVRYSTRRGLRLVHVRPPRIPVAEGHPWNSIRFPMSGFWDSVSGKLCMVGSGTGKLSSNHVVLKLDYLNSSTLFTSLVNGTLGSVDVNSENGFYLNLIRMLGVNLRLKNYKYEVINRDIKRNVFSMLEDMSNVSFGVQDLGQQVCAYIQASGIVELEYESDCSSVNCDFLGTRNGSSTLSLMYFDKIECLEDGRVRFLLGFGDFVHDVLRRPFEPNMTLMSEGKWDSQKRRLNMVACHISTHWDEGFVRDCSVRLSLRFPAMFTLRGRSAVVGELWSSRSVKEAGYFGRALLSSMKNKHAKAARLRYEYTEIEKARRLCANRTLQKGEGKYPDALSSDMRFDMVGRNKKVEGLRGYSSPFYVESQFYQVSPVFGRGTDWQGKQNFSDTVNVSFVLSLANSNDFKLSEEYEQIKSFEISAEGVYDSKSGYLCMTGCMAIETPTGRVQRKSELDCEILIDINYPPLQSKNGETVKGTIESTRNKSESLYFEPFTITSRSIYSEQAKESMWRMDLELAMALISSTLSCIFMGLQLFHVKNHADVLPFISVTMLVLITLGHLVPLLLNFEALFRMSNNSLNVQFGSDGWLEINEVFVRVITMIAFLLEFCLLQMAWSTRSGDGNPESPWISDYKVMYLSLPIYVGGGLIAWFAHMLRMSSKPQSLWGGLKSYAGLILDCFLLPQILFNIFSDSKARALAPSFYIGTTFVRLLPHVYDLYRTQSSVFLLKYIYANPRQDYYSTAWDLIILIGGLVLVVLIYLQQRYGGRCLLPKRLWQRFTYEKVPVSTSR